MTEEVQSQDSVEVSDEIFTDAPEQSEETQATESPAEAPVETKQDFGPYEDLEALNKGYKDLQKELTREKASTFQLKQQLKSLLPHLQGISDMKEEKKSVEDLLKEFVEDPESFLESRFSKFSQKNLGGINQELRRSRVDRAMNKFLAENPHLDDNDEQELLDILSGLPHLTQKDDLTEEDALFAFNHALGMLIKKDPTAYVAKLTAEKETKGADAKDAKVAASGIGGKGGTVDDTSSSDPFDEVLALAKSRSEAYKAGRGK